tara:strand:- start:173 stop:484 length:312 start_codon:yes stop_codon:yes gene_type:complete
MIEPEKLHAIRALCPNADFALIGSDKTIRWVDMKGDSVPSDSAIDAKLTELTTDYNNKKYQRDRLDAYPSMCEQMDMQYWDAVNGTTTWKDAVAKVKSDIPKP